MAAWGTARLRDEATIEFLTRDGWRSPRDVLRECVWCGMPFWAHADGVNAGKARHCSERCVWRKRYWFARAAKKERAA